jgi:hypothetical protein
MSCRRNRNKYNKLPYLRTEPDQDIEQHLCPTSLINIHAKSRDDIQGGKMLFGSCDREGNALNEKARSCKCRESPFGSNSTFANWRNATVMT